MLTRYKAVWSGAGMMAERADDGGFVLYEDAEKLQTRIIELEQQLLTPEQKREAFEKECG